MTHHSEKRNRRERDPDDYLHRQDELLNRVNELRKFLLLVQNTQKFSISPPPAELVFSILKEVITFSYRFFGVEHRDILRRNPSLRIVYRKSLFHGADGKREIDTGLPISIKSSQKVLTRIETRISDYLGDFLEEIIELEDSYFKNKVTTFFNERTTKYNRTKSNLVRPLNTIQRRISDSQVFYLKRQLRKAAQTRSRNKLKKHK